jgi:hypothetical protein
MILKCREEGQMVNRNESQRKSGVLPDPAAKSKPRPGDYPLGCLESRAAARAILQDKDKGKVVIQLVFVSPDGKREPGPQIKIQKT